MIQCSLAFCCFFSSPWMLSGVGMLLSQFHSRRCMEPWDLSQLLWLEGAVSRLGLWQK